MLADKVASATSGLVAAVAAAVLRARPMMSGRTIGGIACHEASSQVFELEPECHHQLRRSAVAATTSCEAAPRVGKAVLPAGEPRGVRSDVFDEEQLTVGLQHPHDLLQGEIGSVHGAQHQGRHDRVDGSVWERQLLRRCVDQPRPAATARQPLGEAAAHRGVWFDQDQFVEVVGVVRQVEAGAGADLDRAAGRSLEQLLAVFAQSRLLADPQEGLVHGREGARPGTRARQ